MRTFHIFNVNKSFSNLLKDDSYPLYYTLEKIAKLDRSELYLACDLYDQVAVPFDRNKVSLDLYKHYIKSDFYTKYQNNHSYINKYRDEKSFLKVGNAYMKLESNVSNPDFFKYFKKKHHLFACDFENKDYFWFDEI